jgi:hypothetical protein
MDVLYHEYLTYSRLILSLLFKKGYIFLLRCVVMFCLGLRKSSYISLTFFMKFSKFWRWLKKVRILKLKPLPVVSHVLPEIAIAKKLGFYMHVFMHQFVEKQQLFSSHVYRRRCQWPSRDVLTQINHDGNHWLSRFRVKLRVRFSRWQLYGALLR